MRISWNWLSEMVDLSSVGGPAGLADLLTRRGLEVEAIERLDAGLEQVVTVQILERSPHPQADRLSICKVTRGEGEPLEIVCGAQNMKAGDRVALAQVGATLPNGMKIQQSKIRGVVSSGMLCSEEELGFKDTSDGILILPSDTPLGRPLAEILGRKDTILTLKLTANRGDCLSHFGLAREIAAALNVAPKRPEAAALKFEGSSIAVHRDAVAASGASEPCPQFFGCLIEGVKIAPSPEWIVRRLESLGLRSINNVVDATNLVLLELGHPVHAYDADRLEGQQIHVRFAREGEVLPLLDGQDVTLAGAELVIADGAQGKRAIGLAGVMGGGNSEVQDGTKRLFLECAEFEPRLVRRAASRHQRHTEAAHRFERGIDPTSLSEVISRLAALVLQLSGGKVVGSVVSQSKPVSAKSIQVEPAFFGDFLGMDVAPENAEKILTSLGCKIAKGKSGEQEWAVTPPSWRRDLTIPADLAEEVARTIGYDAIRETVPALTTNPQPSATGLSGAHLQLNAAKDALTGFGLNETVNFAFTSRSWLERFQLTSSAKVMNPLSEEHEALVPSLLPGLVRNALDNWNRHFGSEPLPIRLFELRPTFHAKGSISAQGEMETGVEERWKLAIALSGPRLAGGLRNELGEVDFYDLKGVVEGLFASLGTKGIRMQPWTAGGQAGAASISGLFHPGQTAEILAGKGEVVGYFGLIHPKLSQDLKVRGALWLAEIDWEMIRKLSRSPSQGAAFKPWSEFPSIERDFALVVKDDVSADKITQLALKAGKPLAKVAKIFDVYRGSQVAKGMTSVAVRVIFYDESRSLQESEAEAASSQILDIWKKELGAELRS
jgi:phenylalanyl-tRNA synthetase beta chain